MTPEDDPGRDEPLRRHHEDDDIAVLRAALEEAQRDAARYRWLRRGRARTTGLPKSERLEVLRWVDRCEADVLKGDALDAAIDAALSSQAAGSQAPGGSGVGHG